MTHRETTVQDIGLNVIQVETDIMDPTVNSIIDENVPNGSYWYSVFSFDNNKYSLCATAKNLISVTAQTPKKIKISWETPKSLANVNGLVVLRKSDDGNNIQPNCLSFIPKKPDLDQDGTPDFLDDDIDGDGVLNINDAFPNDPNESVDSDGDGIGDNSDTDRDGDGVANAQDAFPDDPYKSGVDADEDGVDDVIDIDSSDPLLSGQDADNDGVDDALQNSPDYDQDGDGIKNSEDSHPTDPSQSGVDADEDGIDDAIDIDSSDPDYDNDGIIDGIDSDWNDPNVSGVDHDNDGLDDAVDPNPNNPDTDGDGVLDGADFKPTDPSVTEMVDSDGDGIEDSIDTDRDGDGVANTQDAFPDDPNESVDSDGDGIGDNADTDDTDGPLADADGDGVTNQNDLFPNDPNRASGNDADGDGIEDEFDDDIDGDGFPNDVDADPNNPNVVSGFDQDGDGVDDELDDDIDGDGVLNENDLFPNDPNKSVIESTGDESSFSISSTESLDMIYVEPGIFTMGSPTTEAGRQSDREDEHNVSLTKGFYLGKYEVTQAQYEAVMTGNAEIDSNGDVISAAPSNWPNNPNRPVERVSWDDIQVFLTRLNAQQSANIPTGWAYALPTESQWEYACRAGTTTAYSWGDSITTANANYSSSGYSQTRDVGQYAPNPWGFFDMHGNLYEWTADAFLHAYPSGDPVVDPINLGPTAYGQVIRGGSFYFDGSTLRSAKRIYGSPRARSNFIGFRVALVQA